MIFKRIVVLIFIIFSLVFSGRVTVCAETSSVESSENNSGETIVSYAMKWKDNPNILYASPGTGRGHTMEECDANKYTLDCSGFVMTIYKHFGINTGSNSDDMKNNAISYVNKVEDAKPGDICWWNGHVGLYVGDDKMLHTNTANASPPGNGIHISELETYNRYTSGETLFLRMTDNESLLGVGTSETQENIKKSKNSGSVLTESDLTGMPIESTLKGHQEMIRLYGADDLSLVDGNSLQTIKENINLRKLRISRYFHIITMFLGIMCLVYSVLIIVAAIFDSVNRWFEFSALGLLSLNKWAVVHSGDFELGDIQVGYNKNRNKTYLTFKMLFFRIGIIFAVGLLLVSGILVSFLTDVVIFISKGG